MTPETPITLPFISADREQAAQACGVSPYVIDRATRAGALTPRYVIGTENGQHITKPVYLATDLLHWIQQGQQHKP